MPPHPPAAARRDHGFTLVELLVALTLFAVLSVLLFGGLHFGLRAAANAGARQDRTNELATRYDRLARNYLVALALITVVTEWVKRVPYLGPIFVLIRSKTATGTSASDVQPH